MNARWRLALSLLCLAVLLAAGGGLVALRLGRPWLYTDGLVTRDAFHLRDAGMVEIGVPQARAVLPAEPVGRAARLPDGRLIFARGRAAGGAELVVWDPQRAGIEPEPVVACAHLRDTRSPALAADGTLWFAARDDAGDHDLYVARVERGGIARPERVAEPWNGGDDDLDPAPDPMGGVVFVRRGADGSARLLRVPAGGGEPQPVLPGAGTAPFAEPAFAADGSFLAAVRGGGPEGEIVVLPRLGDAFAPPIAVAALRGHRAPLPLALGWEALAPGQPPLWVAAEPRVVQPWWPGQRWLEELLLWCVLGALLLLVLLQLGRWFPKLDRITICLLVSLLIHVVVLLWLGGKEMVRDPVPDPEGDAFEVHLLNEAALGGTEDAGTAAAVAALRFVAVPAPLAVEAPAAAPAPADALRAAPVPLPGEPNPLPVAVPALADAAHAVQGRTEATPDPPLSPAALYVAPSEPRAVAAAPGRMAAAALVVPGPGRSDLAPAGPRPRPEAVVEVPARPGSVPAPVPEIHDAAPARPAPARVAETPAGIVPAPRLADDVPAAPRLAGAAAAAVPGSRDAVAAAVPAGALEAAPRVPAPSAVPGAAPGSGGAAPDPELRDAAATPSRPPAGALPLAAVPKRSPAPPSLAAPGPGAPRIAARNGAVARSGALDVSPPASLLDLPARRTAAPAPAVAELYGNRFGPRKVEALERFGGSAATEAAVERGLAYLASIQLDDGRIGMREKRDRKYGHVHVGKTALVLLAFLGAGHVPGGQTRYAGNATAAMRFLLDVQDEATGHFGISSAYDHGIATYALTECYALGKDPTLRAPIERALAWIVDRQVKGRDRRNRGGWGYFSAHLEPEDRFARTSITAWMVMALESARQAGFAVPDAVRDEAREFLLNQFDARRGYFLYNQEPGRLASRWRTLPASTPGAVFALLLLGVDLADERVQAGIEYTLARRPRAYQRVGSDAFVMRAEGNVYFWYTASLACFLAGGDAWQEWNEALVRVLPAAQDADGSFRPIDVYAEIAGDQEDDRGYTTAMVVLTLEVYYRYFTPLLVRR
ncbi:MAG: hypothetical protein IT458_10590 [Planctomycetes bacterium]|nr:hypothetical protein [Planctomycetota bacterium]